MFPRLKRLLNRLFRRRLRTDLFVYHNGRRRRAIDPLKAIIVMEESYPQIAMLREDCHAADRNDSPAMLRLVAAAKAMFSTHEYDPDTGRGLTLSQHLALLTQFLSYLGEIKKKHETSPTSLPPTESSFSPTPSPPSSASDSFCIKTESTSAAPESS